LNRFRQFRQPPTADGNDSKGDRRQVQVPGKLSTAREKSAPAWHHNRESDNENHGMPSIEPDILGRLYRLHAPALRLYARQWPGCADDVVQDAFIKLARQAPPPERVLPWLYRVVRNEALSAGRADARRRRREGKASAPEAWFTAIDDQLDASDATRLLAELPLDLREVIVARIWGGLTFEEVAHLVGCSLPTGHRRYQAGLIELRERLEGRWTRTPPAPTAT
jgi:RNA polymerase sigma factor (sigma-70 family)